MPKESVQRLKSRTPAITPLLAILLLFSAGCSDQKSQAPQQAPSSAAPPEQTTEQPASPAQAAAPAVAGGDGEAVYTRTCKICHDAGVANAPKLGDKAAWAPRIAKGDDVLFQSVKNGLNAMPPKGTCTNCSDDDLRNAIAYLVAKGS